MKKPHKCPYPIQKQLFDKVKEKYHAAGRSWITQYMNRFGLTKTPAYARLAGQTPITFDEGFNIMKQEGILLQEGVQAPDIVKNLSEALLHDLSLFNGFTEKKVVLMVQDLPLIYLKMNRLLAGFKMYSLARLNQSTPGQAFEPFSRDWLNHENIAAQLNTQKKILQHLLPMPRTDIWTEGMFDNTVKVIGYIDQVGGFAQPGLREEIIGAVFSLVGDLKKMAAEQSSIVKVYENTLFSIGNQLLFNSFDYTVLYHWSDTNLNMRLTDTALIQKHQTLIDNMILRGNPVHPYSEVQFARFFNRLENRIKSFL